jgi:hypothetical protein
MNGGRIESERASLALDRTHERAPRPTADVRPSDSLSAEATTFAPEHFEAFVKATGQHAVTSPRRHIADFVAPKMSDPTVLQSAQLVPTLERLVSSILPNLEGGEELRALAGPVIADEIARHRDLLTRLHGGIAA